MKAIMNKRLLILVPLCAVFLCSCSLPKEVTETPSDSTFEPIVSQTSDTVVSCESSEIDSVEFSSIDSQYAWQLQVIYENRDMWEFSENHPFGDSSEVDYLETCKYAIMDFDADGYLEIIKSGYEGTGIYSYSFIYEVNEDGNLTRFNDSALNIIDLTTYVPDVCLNDSLLYYVNDNNNRVYLARDLTSYGMQGQLNTYGCIQFDNNSVTTSTVCRTTICVDESGTETLTYQDCLGNDLNEEDYTSIYEEYISPAVNEVNLGWFYSISPESLSDSLVTFLGEDN